MKHGVIIVAGGKGLRMGGDLPKQFVPLNGKPVLMHTLDVFYRWNINTDITLVIPSEQEAYWQMLCRELVFTVPHRIVKGGETRFHSVRNGLQAVPGDVDLIAVHDGVRPFVAGQVITDCFAEAELSGAAIPVITMIESVREIDGVASHVVDRNRLRIVQTPQVFKADLLRQAYQLPYNECITDDASLVEATGYKISLVNGNRENIKLTNPSDLYYAESLIRH